MAALVQTYPQQTYSQQAGTVTLLQTRPSSASGMMPMQPQPTQPYGHGSQQRASFHGMATIASGGHMVYRGNVTPVQPYAFTSTPSLHPPAQWQQFPGNRSTSTPAVPTVQSFEYGHNMGRPRYPASASMTNLPSTNTLGVMGGGSRDDSALPGTRRVAAVPRPQSSHMPNTSVPSPVAQTATTTKAPERYRRPQLRTNDSSNASSQPGSTGSSSSSASVATVAQVYNSQQRIQITRNPSPAMLNRPNSVAGILPGSTADDLHLPRGQSQEDMLKSRRRSLPALDSADFPKPLTPPESRQPEESSRPEQLAPANSADKEPKPATPPTTSASSTSTSSTSTNTGGARLGTPPGHGRTGSSDSRVSSSRSSPSRPSSSANRNQNPSVPTGNPALLSTVPDAASSSSDYPKLVNIPPRISSSDAATTKRAINPSPLSKPVTMEAETEKAEAPAAVAAPPASPSKVPPSSPVSRVESPALRQLAAINEKGKKLKSKTSRLRRAFSFGSAAEFRDVANVEATDVATTPTTTAVAESSQSNAPSKLHKQPTADEMYDAEQERIAKLQEAGGIGNSIYSGGKIFSGSTDNISISSTASSASIMIRKMGRGMKKGGRSLVGLFRPKSIIGVPAADAKVPEASQATVSMVTVEAERERVNVNADPHTQHGGGTGFPRLERNSIDASKTASTTSERLGSSGTDNSAAARKSIVGGEKERAEVLAAVRKGILKHSPGSASPSPTPVDAKAPTLPIVPQINDSPNSSAPSTPNDEAQGHRRTGSIAIGTEDYFMSALRLRQETKSAPGTPQNGAKRNATFSPRIVFYDTWPSQEYDRRGEIATCNRLTPMLAQQIKEELNTFKMEMEVHENSKIYTHFF